VNLKRRHRLPVFRFDKALGIARGAKARLRKSGAAERRKEHAKNEQRLRREIESKKQELSQIDQESRPTKDGTEILDRTRRKKKTKQELFQLERQFGVATEGVTAERVTGAWPDFVVIGAQKGGTTSLYDLLTQHPLVERAASKELHFFDLLFDEGVEWYRSCFPIPGWKDGRRTITGEGTPYYLFHPHAAKRMAQVIPQARLIALLRNPVDRAYSHYQMMVRRGFESLGFEQSVEAEAARLRSAKESMLEDEYHASLEHQRFSYLSRGIYVDQLIRWARFFSREQMLVLKSEDLFERPRDTFRLVYDFFDLPHWEPQTWEVRKKGGKYKQEMDPATRHRLEEYFEPHNKRLYEYLGTDFGW
jgi:hypothetical protein